MNAVPIEMNVSITISRLELLVHRLTRDTDWFSVEYAVKPALSEDISNGVPLDLRVEAADDTGDTYTDGGGFRQNSGDGTQTRGTAILQPALAINARKLTLRFVFSSETTQLTCSVSVDLPSLL